ncbi:unnamed protein product [Heligmosomoides polygyrus]|uniref:HTH_48 domain-containing protein n=1 Tax=Heligmosomoides polygyrus TaxID=6339 RepID=A0A183GB92_HELPZ|nr:unnamed protein product [Heligmosomoides polygyrus]
MNQRDIRVLYLYEWKSGHIVAAAARNINIDEDFAKVYTFRRTIRSGDERLDDEDAVGYHHSLTTTNSKPWWEPIRVKLREPAQALMAVLSVAT